MTKYAAYGDDAVYGIGDSPEAALADAQDQQREPIVALKTARISNELCEWIEINGWNAATDTFADSRTAN